MTNVFYKTICFLSLTLLAGTNAFVVPTESAKPLNVSVSAYSLTLLEKIIDFCPQTTLCPTNENKTTLEEPENACCLPCDCSASCSVAGTCCTNVNTTAGQVSEPFYKPKHLEENCFKTYAGNLSVLHIDNNIHSYMLHQYCPEIERQSDDVIEKCLRPNDNILDEILPVYSSLTEKNYRNIFCAICNNDTNGTAPWKSHVTCRAIPLFPNGGESVDFLQTIRNDNECLVQFKPLNKKVKYCIDENEIISDCLQESPFYDPAVEQDCLQTNLYSPVKGKFGLYKNIFCFRCNEISSELDFQPICQPMPLFEIPAFSTLVQLEDFFNFQPTASVGPKVMACNGAMTYDKDLKTCILKFCAISEMAVGKQCINMMKKVKGISLDYRLKLLFNFDTFIISSHDNLFAMLEPLILHNEHSFTCGKKILKIEAQGNHMVVRIQLTKADQTHTDLLEELHTFEKKVQHFNQQSAEGRRNYTVELEDSPFEPVNSTYVSLAVYSDFDGSWLCPNVIAVSKMQFCETVKVEKDDLLSDGVAVVNNVSFYPGEYIPLVNDRNEKPAALVCYNLYVTRMLQKIGNMPNEASTRENPQCIWIFVDVVILLFSHSFIM